MLVSEIIIFLFYYLVKVLLEFFAHQGRATNPDLLDLGVVLGKSLDFVPEEKVLPTFVVCDQVPCLPNRTTQICADSLVSKPSVEPKEF